MSVTWWRPGKQGAKLVSNEEGRVRFESLPAIPLRVYPAWTPSRERPWVAPQAESVVPGGMELVIQMRRGVVLEGTVAAETDEAGGTGKVYVRAVDPKTNVTRAWCQVDGDGAFALVFSPEEEGPLRVIAMRYDAKGTVYESIRNGVRPRDPPLTLRLRRRGG